MYVFYPKGNKFVKADFNAWYKHRFRNVIDSNLETISESNGGRNVWQNKIFSGKGRGMTYDLMAHWIGKLIAKRKKLEKKLGARKNIATYCLEVKNYNFPFYCLAT